MTGHSHIVRTRAIYCKYTYMLLKCSLKNDGKLTLSALCVSEVSGGFESWTGPIGALVCGVAMTTKEPPAAPPCAGVTLPSYNWILQLLSKKEVKQHIRWAAFQSVWGVIPVLEQDMKANSHSSSCVCRPSREQTTSHPCPAFTQRICRRFRSLRMYLSSNIQSQKYYQREMRILHVWHHWVVGNELWNLRINNEKL